MESYLPRVAPFHLPSEGTEKSDRTDTTLLFNVRDFIIVAIMGSRAEQIFSVNNFAIEEKRRTKGKKIDPTRWHGTVEGDYRIGTRNRNA